MPIKERRIMPDLDKVLEAFNLNLKCLQSIPQIKRRLEEYGKSWLDFEEWVEKKKGEKDNQEPVLPRPPKLIPKRICPECAGAKRKSYMHIWGVNTNAENQTGGKERSQWICPICLFEIYSEKEPIDEVQPYLKEVDDNIRL